MDAGNSQADVILPNKPLLGLDPALIKMSTPRIKNGSVWPNYNAKGPTGMSAESATLGHPVDRRLISPLQATAHLHTVAQVYRLAVSTESTAIGHGKTGATCCVFPPYAPFARVDGRMRGSPLARIRRHVGVYIFA
jgi:hypothetical protein